MLWLLGGSVEWKTMEGHCTPCRWPQSSMGLMAPGTEAPSHAWSEIELPASQCYLILGGGTSTFRDRGTSAFRLLLHDTTFRHWPREEGRLVYEGLLLHRPRKLQASHVRLLRHVIEHGEIRESRGAFERSLDQDGLRMGARSMVLGDVYSRTMT